jgi:glycosyltransferase involved in cell wall biosynthesis
MKIALVVPSLEPGGVETFVLNVGRYFLRKGHTVEVIATESRGSWFSLFQQSGLQTVCLDVQASFSSVTHAVRVGKWLRAQNYDVVFLNHSRHAQAVIGMLPASCKVIPIVHNDDPEVYRVACANATRWGAAVGTSRKVVEMTAQRLPSHKLYPIEQGIEVPPLPRASQRDLSFDPMRVLYVGRLYDRQKGVLLIPDILHAARQAGIKVHMTIAGSGSDGDALRVKVERFGLSENVTFMDGRDHAEVMDLMGRHHVLVMPSRYEGFGIVALEAQAHGCVPIANRLRGATEVSIAHGESGFLVNDQSLDEYVDFLKRMYDDPKFWRKLSENGHSRMVERFSIEVMGEAYLAVAEEVPVYRQGRGHHLAVDLSLFGLSDYLPNALKTILKRLLMGRATRSPHPSSVR